MHGIIFGEVLSLEEVCELLPCSSEDEHREIRASAWFNRLCQKDVGKCKHNFSLCWTRGNFAAMKHFDFIFFENRLNSIAKKRNQTDLFLTRKRYKLFVEKGSLNQMQTFIDKMASKKPTPLQVWK